MKRVFLNPLEILTLSIIFVIFPVLSITHSNNRWQKHTKIVEKAKLGVMVHAATGVKYAFPFSTKYPYTSKFGDPRPGRLHEGLDIGAPLGTPILAAQSGKVTFTGNKGGYGLTVQIDHPELGSETLYAHLSAISVRKGQNVKAGEVIGKVGNTGRSFGPHLHFEIRKGGVAINPIVLLGAPGQKPSNTANPTQQVCHNTFVGIVCIDEEVSAALSANTVTVPSNLTPYPSQNCGWLSCNR